MKDKRRFPRFDCSYTVRYTTRGTASLESLSVAEDISRSGLRLPVSRMIKAGDVLSLDIYPKEKEGPISATGVVRWTQDRPRDRQFTVEAGVHFLQIEPIDIDRLIPENN